MLLYYVARTIRKFCQIGLALAAKFPNITRTIM